MKELRRRLLKPFHVEELPAGLELTSFRAPNDTICAMLPLDGSLQPGPYRRAVCEAIRDLKEMQVLRGEKLRREMQRRDADAMTAFFVERLQKSWVTMPMPCKLGILSCQARPEQLARDARTPWCLEGEGCRSRSLWKMLT